MDPLISGLLSLGAVLAFILIGVPVALSIMSVTIAGMYILAGDAFLAITFKTLPFSASSTYTYAVIPMFILMGEFAGGARIIGDLYQAAYRWLGGFKAGLYCATVLASAGFAAISGSTVVNAAVFTRIALPEIVRLGYHRGFGAGCIAASGALAAMIPPSLTVVLFGILTGESIGAMLIAGVLPGLLTAAMLMIGVYVSVALRPELAPEKTEIFSFKDKVASLKNVWPAALLASVVLGGIYSGTVSPSAAGTVGAAGAFLIAVMKGRMTGELFWGSLKRAASLTAVLFFIIIAGLLMSRLLLFNGSVTALTDVLTGGGVTPFAFMTGVVISYFILGMFMDPISMMVITVPFIYPTVKALGLDPIWFGIIIVKLIEIAAITPPVGINLFAVLSVSGGTVSAAAMFRGIFPFVILELMVLALLLAFPEISTFLPGVMLGK